MYESADLQKNDGLNVLLLFSPLVIKAFEQNNFDSQKVMEEYDQILN